ncbi:membrane protein [Heyndrickxia sporothermodurans]|uniref:YitT family protein n=1 Tax=Heyndrickxia TaxID=2837504 RepID=UPI000D4C2140|nr:YitT family protein [Heyndrickxia sporothermodurans]PTY76372.1 membrane protein [Heyndrickxia sporothermodurans]
MIKNNFRNVRKISEKYFYIILGSIIQGFSMGCFLFPHFIPSGGAGGITVLLNYWFALPMSIGLFIINASMLLIAVHYLGTSSAIGTLVGITGTSIAVNLFEVYVPFSFQNVWIDLFIGSATLGIGVGLLLRQGVSHGGIGILALIISKLRKIPPGKPLFLINGVIFIIISYIISWQIVVQAIICQWFSTKVIDWIFHLQVPPNIISFLQPQYRKK